MIETIEHRPPEVSQVRRQPKSRTWRVVALLLVGSVAVLSSHLVCSAAIGAAQGRGLWSHSLPLQEDSLLGHLLLIPLWSALTWMFLRRHDRTSLKQIGLRASSASLPLWGLGLAASTVAMVGGGLLAATGNELTPVQPSPPSMMGLALLLVMCLSAALPQELLWRGYLLRILRDKPVFAVTVSANIFGLLHLIANWGEQDFITRLVLGQLAGAFGVLAGVLVVVFRSWWPALGVHCGYILGNYILDTGGVGEGLPRWGLQLLFYLLIAGAVQMFRREAFQKPLSMDR